MADLFAGKDGENMSQINWKAKLTSRKFWAAVIGFVTALMMGFGLGESETSQIAAVIMAGGTLIAYIIGEGMVDASRSINDRGTENA